MPRFRERPANEIVLVIFAGVVAVFLLVALVGILVLTALGRPTAAAWDSILALITVMVSTVAGYAGGMVVTDRSDRDG